MSIVRASMNKASILEVIQGMQFSHFHHQKYKTNVSKHYSTQLNNWSEMLAYRLSTYCIYRNSDIKESIHITVNRSNKILIINGRYYLYIIVTKISYPRDRVSTKELPQSYVVEMFSFFK